MKTDFEFEENQSGVSGMFFWLFAVATLFLFLGEAPFWGTELRWAESSREMLISKNFLSPTVNWKAALEQSPFFAWIIAFFMHFLGCGEWVARIPSALAALVGLYGTFKLALRFFDRKTAVLSCWFLLSCYSYLFWGRMATAEAANTAVSVLAVCFFLAAEKKAGWKKYFLFYLAASIGVFLKGFSSLAVLIAFLLPHLSIRKRWLLHLKKRNLAALCIGCFLGTGLFYLALNLPLAENMTFSGSEIIQYILGQIQREFSFKNLAYWDKDNPIYGYFCYFPSLLLPWTLLFFLCAFVVLREKRENDGKIRELLWGIGSVLLLLTVLTPHGKNQVLPLVPFGCIFTAAVIYREGVEPVIERLITFLRWCVIFIGSLALAFPVMLPVFKMMFHRMPPLLVQILIPVAGLVILTVLVLDSQPGNCVEHWTGIPCRLASMILGMALITTTFFGTINLSLPVYRTEKAFVKSLVPILAGIPPKDIAFYETCAIEPFLFYLQWNEPVSLLKKQEGMQKFLKSCTGKKAVFICRSRQEIQRDFLTDLAAAGIQTKDLKPAKQEPGKREKWFVFLVDIPEKNTSSQVQQNKNGSLQL